MSNIPDTFTSSSKDGLSPPHDNAFQDIHSSNEWLQLEIEPGHEPSNSNNHNYNKSIPFHNLPPELILGVAEELDPVGVKALRIACRPFYYYIPPGDDWKARSNRLKFARLLDRDGILETSAVCSECEELHAKSCFSAWELLLHSPETRMCEGSKRLYYFRPGFALSMKEMKALREKSMFDNRPVICFDDWACAFDRVPRLSKEREETKGCVFQRFEIIHCGGTDVISKQTVTDSLRQLDVPICPHMRISDPNVVNRYVDRPPLENARGLREPASPAFCEERHCGTRFFFTQYYRRHGPYGYEGRFLMLDVIRRIGDLDNPNNSTWWAQIILSQPDPGLENHWVESYDRRDSRLEEGVIPRSK